MSAVLVLNAGYEKLQFVSLRHAIRMLIRQVAEVEEEEEADANPIGHFPRPSVIRLKRYVQMRWRNRGGPTWSRKAMLNRDGQTCAFCGGHALRSASSWVVAATFSGGCSLLPSNASWGVVTQRVSSLVPDFWSLRRSSASRQGEPTRRRGRGS